LRIRLALGVGALLLAGGAFLLVFRFVESMRQEAAGAASGARARKSASNTLAIEYYADRNALRDSLLVGDRLLALGRAGNLLVFDRGNFSLLGERQARRSFVCIGPGDEESIHAAVSNGAIVRVRLADLSLTQVGEVAGRPEWIGRRNAGLLVAFSSPRRVPYGSSEGRGFAFELKDLGNGRVFPLDAPTSFFLDSKDRVWVGSDSDERGAKLQVIDLDAGTMRDISAKDGWDGLQGTSELADGQIWAFGGSARPRGRASFIARADAGGSAVTLRPVRPSRRSWPRRAGRAPSWCQGRTWWRSTAR